MNSERKMRPHDRYRMGRVLHGSFLSKESRKAAAIMSKETKTEEKNLYQRLHGVMEDVGYVQKETKLVNGQYRFASHDAVTAAVRPALLKHRVLAFPQNMKRSQDGNRTEIDMDIMFINIDKPEEIHLVPSCGYGIDTQDKGPGKAMSYAVKYGILKALSLETGDDPERDLADHEPEDLRIKKIRERDIAYDLSLCRTQEELEAFELNYHEVDLPDFIMDSLENRKKGIGNNVVFPSPKFGFIDVEEALAFGTLAKKNIEEGPIDGLEDWMMENDAKIRGLDAMLKAAKYNKDGKPSERLFRAYEQRTKLLAAE